MTKRLDEISMHKLTKYVVDAGQNLSDTYDKRSNLRKSDKHDSDEMKATDRTLNKREKGLGRAADSIHRKIGKPIKEDAPTVNASGGNIAGLGVGPQGEPGVPQKKRNKSTPTPVILSMLRRKAPNPLAEETFAGAIVFEVSSSTFHNAKVEKRKGKHWKTYLDECDELAEIREYANRNPGKPIVLQNRNTCEMVYVRYGKAR